jgi:hypothetical protein
VEVIDLEEEILRKPVVSPALNPRNRPSPIRPISASAKMLRAEFPVRRKSTLQTFEPSVIGHLFNCSPANRHSRTA